MQFAFFCLFRFGKQQAMLASPDHKIIRTVLSDFRLMLAVSGLFELFIDSLMRVSLLSMLQISIPVLIPGNAPAPVYHSIVTFGRIPMNGVRELLRHGICLLGLISPQISIGTPGDEEW